MAVLGQIQNVFRDKKTKAINPMVFFPWSEVDEPEDAAIPTPAQHKFLAEVFPVKK